MQARGGRGRGRAWAISRHQKFLGWGKLWDLRKVPPFCLCFWVSGAPISLRRCSWQPSRAGAGALAAARNLPSHFCARGGLWQADSHAKWAWQKGGSGLRSALETSAPPRPRLRVAGNKVSGRAGRLGRDPGGSAPGPAPRWGHLGWAARPCAVSSRNKRVEVPRMRGEARVFV